MATSLGGGRLLARPSARRVLEGESNEALNLRGARANMETPLTVCVIGTTEESLCVKPVLEDTGLSDAGRNCNNSPSVHYGLDLKKATRNGITPFV